MKTIVAVDNNWSIGKDGGLLFSVPEDMKFFRTATSGKVVVMGRKTLDSFPGGKPLKNRINIVLTRDRSFSREGVTVCTGKAEVLEEIKKYDTDDVFIIGGESVYREFIDECDTALVTLIDETAPEADRHFPDLSEKEEWKLFSVSEEKESGGHKFRFAEYRKQEV